MLNASGQSLELFSHNTQLVSVQVVRAIKGQSADAIMSAVESGKFRFVWNVGAKGARSHVPAVRLWLPEVFNPASVANLTLPQVIARILGNHRSQFRGVEVSQILMTSRPQIHRLNKTGALRGKIRRHTLWIQRTTLERFLTARWQGNQ